MYRPAYARYQSESESETDADTDSTESTDIDTDTDTDTTTTEEGFQDYPDYTTLANALAGNSLLDASGTTSLPTLGYPVTQGGYATFNNLTVAPDPSGNLLKPQTQTVTSIIMVDSRDRDRNVFAQPTSLTLRVPRVYKNVTNFQIIQLKLLSAFYYFRRSKENIDISILELGRTVLNLAGISVPAIIKNTIREGSYDINGLLTELNTQLNNTPIFYDYLNGITDFAAKFAVTGDFGLNFNYPGDYYYDSLQDQFIVNPTTDTIISKYFVQRYAGLSSYTADQIKIAYYYPVLKEVLLDQTFTDGVIDLSLPTTSGYLLPGETAYSRVVYTFQGINDPVALELISQNVAVLDIYRVENTFRYYLINKYNCYYEPQSNKVVIASPSLNTSLVNLLNVKRAEYFAAQLSTYGITVEQYNTLTQTNQILLAVLNDMYFYIQQYLAAYFGIPFNTFTVTYLANPAFTLPIKDGLGATNVPQTFSGQVLSNPLAATSADTLSILRQSAPPYWNRLQGLGSTFAYMNPVLSGESGAKGLPLPSWSADMEVADPVHPIVASNVIDVNNPNTSEIGFLYTNPRTGLSEYVLPLEATQYTSFRFKSPVRQTVRLTTVPRPTKFRYPAYNTIAYDASNVALFDNSYNFVAAGGPIDVSGITLTLIPGFGPAAPNFGADVSTAINYWAGSTATLSVTNSRQFYEFYTPWPNGAPSTPAVTYPLRLNLTHGISGETFAAPLYMFLYHDRAAFMADISGNRSEKAIHYKAVVSTTTAQSTVSLDMTAYANQHYYVMTRSQDNSFATERYIITPWYPSGTAYTSLTSTLVGFDPLANPASNLTNFNYAANADPAFIQLPTDSSLWPNTTPDPATSSLAYSPPPIGYDENGVSTDLTNYVGFIQGDPASNAVPGAQIRADPTTGYLFQAKSPYNPSTQTYFYSTSQNTILAYDGGSVYSPSTVTARQTSIVHWYGTAAIPTTANQVQPAAGSLSAATPPYTTSLGGYTYETLQDASGNDFPVTLDLGDGVMGIAFVPDAGTWDIDRFLFRSAVIDPAADPNAEIRYLGIFPAAVTSNHSLQSLTLPSAAAVLAYTSSITYNSSNDNFGFDAAGGTYYEFTRQAPTQAYLTGYRQAPYEYNFNVNSYYIAVPFTATSTPTFYRNLVGSHVAYPRYSATQVVPAVTSPIGPLSPPTGREFTLPDGLLPGGDPTLGPPPGYTDTQSQYEQSVPITNNMLTYAKPYPLMTSTSAMRAWEPLPYAPNTVVADCSGFLLLRDADFRVFSYPYNTATSTFTELYQFTADQVFPPSSNTDYLGAAANETRFAFFGLSNSAGPSPTLVIRTMDPVTGALDETYTEPAPLGFQSSVALFKATYNNGGGYVMSAQAYDAGSATTVRTVLSKANASTTSYTVLTDLTPAPSLTQYYVAQSPKETAGRFWAFPADAAGLATSAIFVNPNLAGASPTPPVAGYKVAVGPLAAPTAFPEPAIWALGSSATSPIVTRDVARDRVFFLTAAGPTQFYEAIFPAAPTYGGPSTIASTVSSVYTFPITPSTLIAGATGGLWATAGTSIFGNRGDATDAPKPVDQAWQIFYPVQRIVMRQISKQIAPSTSLYPEYPHTAIAAYDGSGNITADTSGRWGLEVSTNFITADFAFKGTYFNANDYAVPVYDNRTTSDYYYFTVRNYTPTEKSQVLLRVGAPNRYTFGYVTPLDLSGEISTAKVVSTTNSQFDTYFWDPIYRNSILAFDSNFIIDSNGRTFGGGVIPGYGGSNISSVTGWGDFYGRFRSLFQTYSTSVQLASTINTAVNSNLSNFITTDLQYIIPPQALNRQRFTDPLRFSILWKSALLPTYAALEEEWGFGWNLGYTKADTPYETVQKATSFFKILDDYISLRLNPEFDMNRMDTTLKENLAATQEPTGVTKSFYGKLLLAPFGSYAQTMISNPLSFNPPFGKIDRLTFQWVNQVGAIIDNADCEWNAVVQLVETMEVATVSQPALISP